MKKFIGGCSIVVQKIIQWAFTLAFLAAIFYGLILLADQGGEVEQLISLVAMAVIILFLLYRIFIRPSRRKRKRVTVPATILRIDIPNNISQPILYHTKVKFESRGKRIDITLTPEQVNAGFIDKYTTGDTGMLTYSGDRMYDWVPPTPEKPLVNVRHRTVFISYAHEWGEDAEYLAQYFRQAGLDVWHDKTQVRVGDRLSEKIEAAIRGATFFVPLLSQDYWNSEWCIQEYELAAKSGVKFIPIKVSAGEVVMPPHIQRIYRQQLGEPVFLDLRGRNPVAQLRELTRQMTN
jgi:hypothetical protein